MFSFWQERRAPDLPALLSPRLRGAFLFFMTMTTESRSASTKGGSVLPTMTPELLWFESHEHGAPERAVTLPDGAVVFAHRGGVCAMPEADWQRFRAFQQAA